jgi:hypothetical protein
MFDIAKPGIAKINDPRSHSFGSQLAISKNFFSFADPSINIRNQDL